MSIHRLIRPMFAMCLAGSLTMASSAQAVTISPPDVGPTPFNSGSWARASTSGDPDTIRISTLSSQDQTDDIVGPYGSSQFTSNLAGGSVGVAATIDSSPGQHRFSNVTASIQDTLVFDFGGAPSGQVSFSLTIDGILSNGTQEDNGLVIGGGRISVVDVTGLDESFFFAASPDNLLGGLLTFNSTEVLEFGDFQTTAVDYIVNDSGGLALIRPGDEQNVIDGLFGIGVADDYLVSTDGALVPFQRILGGSFEAIAGRSYAFMIRSEASVSGFGPASADLMSTTTFAFTDLDGGTFTSDSGVFPELQQQQVHVIPEPATAALSLLTLGALAFGAGRRRSRR